MPARAHRRAPDPLAGAVNPLPPCRGPSPLAPRGSGLALYAPPTKAPGKVAPFDPRPPTRSANWRICKIAISSAPSRVFTDPPFQSPGSLSPGKVPPPRACTPRLALGRPLRAPASPPPHPPVRPTPPPRQLAPHAPLPRAAKPRRPPLAPGLGEGGPPVAHGYVEPACRGVVPRGSPCQGPHRNIPRHPGTPHATRRGHSCGPSLPQPRTVGPGSLLHRLTDPIWGVKMQNAVQVAGNCSGGQFLYGGGPCTAKSPYKVGHFFEKLSDILGT